MPTPAIRKYAQEANVSEEHVEKLWSQAKAIADERFENKDEHYWAYVNATVRRRLELSHKSQTED